MELTILAFLKEFNFLMFLLFALMYSYQIFYMVVALKAKKNKSPKMQNVHSHKYAVIIAARNEELVIGQLIKSIKNQNYPRELIDIFVVADNCTDDTARVAAKAGAVVRERFNKVQVGKGYALNYMMNIISNEYSSRKYEGYFIFDADNLLEENYIAEMNMMFHQGYRVITSYRNSKNYDQNWISAGYGLWFMHEAEYLNLPRMALNLSCSISGTGFLVHANLIKENGGWTHHLLTEDIEFSVSQIINGEKIGYCRNAIFYDEQPETWIKSWHQRLRWARGFYQVIVKYGKDLVGGILKGKSNWFSCYDMIMTIMPAMLVSSISFFIYGLFSVGIFLDVVDGAKNIQLIYTDMVKSIGWYYGLLFIIGFITTITEWKKIHSSWWKKLAYTITFPLFMFTYIPISIVALFINVEWKPITHTVAKSLDDVR